MQAELDAQRATNAELGEQVRDLREQLRDQQAMDQELRARLARLETLIAAASAKK